MTLAEACAWSLARSLVIALLAWPVCRAQVNWLRSLSDRKRRFAWWAIMIPFLCPELWSGYAWRDFAVWLAGMGVWERLPTGWAPAPQSVVVRDAAVHEVLLDLLLLLRAIPVGTLVLYFSPPPPVSREAVFCWSLTKRVSAYAGVSAASIRHSQTYMLLHPSSFLLHPSTLRVRLESLTYILPALGLMFLVAFQEFELASLIGRPAWTVWLFDAQVGGLELSESLRKSVLPTFCQLVILTPLAWLILRRRSQVGTARRDVRRMTLVSRGATWIAILAGLGLLLVAPALLVGQETFRGLLRITQSATQARMLFHEIFTGLGYAITTAVLSALTAAGLLSFARRSRWGLAGIGLAVLPGLVGSLVLGLTLNHLLLHTPLRFAYKSPLSLGSGMVLFLLPRALLVLCLLHWSARPAGAHLAMLMRESPAANVRATAGELMWQLRWRGQFWGAAVLAYWGFFDLTIASLLAPVTIVSAPVMLYNQMHFGKNAILSAFVLLTVLVPLAVFLVAALLRHMVFRWFWR
jgi:hypothetical protein